MKKSIKFYIFILGYISLLTGFYFNENSSGGALPDYNHHFKVLLSFLKDFQDSLLNYDRFKTDHSPFFISTLLFMYKFFGNNEYLLRFFYIHLALLIPLIFYLCLKIIFKGSKNNLIFIFSCILFLSPHVRSLSIWPGSEILSLIFLLLSIYCYLRFKEQKNFILFFSILNVITVAIASYYKPSYSFFSIGLSPTRIF
jgi:predicted membrane-bound mannosyltransferase